MFKHENSYLSDFETSTLMYTYRQGGTESARRKDRHADEWTNRRRRADGRAEGRVRGRTVD